MKTNQRTSFSQLSSAISITVLLLPCAIGVAQQNAFYSFEKNVLETEALAYFLLPPRAVADHVTQVRWSPSGNYLLYHQIRPFTATNHSQLFEDEKRSNLLHRAVIWNVATGKQLYSPYFRGRMAEEDYFDWFAGQDIAIRVGTSQNTDDPRVTPSLHWMIPGAAQMTSMSLGANTAYASIAATNPQSPRVVVIAENRGANQITVQHGDRMMPTVESWAIIADASGTIRRFPHNLIMARMTWSPDGKSLFSRATVYNRLTKKRDEKVHVLNEISGKFEPYAGTMDFDTGFERSRPKLEVECINPKSATDSAAVRRAIIHENWREIAPKGNADKPHAVVALEVEEAELSSSEKHVAFISNGVLQVREIVPIDPSSMKKAKDDEGKKKAISDAKQSALALIMYASDYDDTLPANGAGWMDNVGPYARNSSTLSNFVYTYSGGSYENIENVAEQEIGYVEGPGGRAVTYADGHVVWVPNTPVPAVLQERRRK